MTEPSCPGCRESAVVIATLLGRVEQVKAFRILDRELDPEMEGEAITATRKIKRKQMEERFGDLIESMYDDREDRLLAQQTGGIAT